MANKQVLDRNRHTPWDVSTAAYDEKSKDVSSQDTIPYGVFFKPDGTKMYIVGSQYDTAYQYSLSTAWDVSTATYDEKSKDVSGQDTTPIDVFFKPDVDPGGDFPYQLQQHILPERTVAHGPVG